MPDYQYRLSARKATFFEQAPKDKVMSIPVEFTDTTIRLEDAITINEGRPVYGYCHPKLELFLLLAEILGFEKVQFFLFTENYHYITLE